MLLARDPFESKKSTDKLKVKWWKKFFLKMEIERKKSWVTIQTK